MLLLVVSIWTLGGCLRLQPTPPGLELQRTEEARSSAMCGDTISSDDLAEMTEALAEHVERMGSLEELEEWLRSQPCVQSVEVADYVIKTRPPQKELFTTFKMDDSSTVTRVLDIILYPDERLGLAGLHEP
ncbi:MAG: hypothetical protein PVG25_05330 [Anaerolineae bacterium]